MDCDRFPIFDERREVSLACGRYRRGRVAPQARHSLGLSNVTVFRDREFDFYAGTALIILGPAYADRRRLPNQVVQSLQLIDGYSLNPLCWGATEQDRANDARGQSVKYEGRKTPHDTCLTLRLATMYVDYVFFGSRFPFPPAAWNVRSFP